ncbi:MAG: hypothetical protein PVJ57_21770 [Phycisphaerae bacterium]
MFRKPAILSATGIAAIVVLSLLLLPRGTTPEVRAAMIVQKLTEQYNQPIRLDLTMEGLEIGPDMAGTAGLKQVVLDGYLQLSGEGVAGDVAMKIVFGDDSGLPVSGELSMDVGLALAGPARWLLIRSITATDPVVQMQLGLVCPAGSETLVLLPEDQEGFELGVDVGDELDQVRAQLDKMVEELSAEEAEEKGLLRKQPDGTFVLTVPVGTHVGVPGMELPEEAMTGTTVEIVYDPATGQVLNMTAAGLLGRPPARVVVAFHEGGIDPALLDVEPIKAREPRILDVGALMSKPKPPAESTEDDEP